MCLRVFLIAGEPSGDRLGAALLEGLKCLVPEIEVDGVGGPLMQAQGLVSHVPISDLAVMGFSEVLPKLPRLLRHIHHTANEVVRQKPDVLITIDSPDFCLRVIRKVRRLLPMQRVVHYVAPSVWAWRPERAARMATIVDQVLCLLPFEPAYMEAEGMRADFVGHPVTTEPVPEAQELARFRDEFHLSQAAPLVLALPGSRRGEIERLMPIFAKALDLSTSNFPNAQIVLPTLPHLRDRVSYLARDWPNKPVILSSAGPEGAALKRVAFKASDLALAASGTVSLELAAANTPMVIAYDMNWLSRRIIAAKLQIDTVTLVNLVSDTREIPEFLGANCKPEKIAAALTLLMRAPDSQNAAMDLTMTRLGRGATPPGLRAARAILDALDHGKSAI